MKRNFLLIIFFSFFLAVHSQVDIAKDTISLEMVKARKIGMLSIQFGNSPININSGKDSKRVQLRLKVQSLQEDPTLLDPNKLSLVSEKYKARFSVSEISFATFFRSKSFGMLTSNPEKEKLPFAASYDPSIKNTFFDFSIENITDYPIRLNFGTKRKPNVHTIYFRPNTIDKNVLDVFFVVPNNFTEGDLYYENTIISKIKVRK